MTPEIAVTTTASAFPRWSVALRSEGLDPVSLPCIEVRPTGRTEQARVMAESADWLILTSPRAVFVLWPDGDMPAVPAAVVGTGTARAVAEAGGEAAIVGDGDGDDLAETVRGPLRGRSVFFPHGAKADPARFDRLASVGAKLEALAVYETLSIPPASRPVDGAVFGSPSAVEGWSRSRGFDDLTVTAAMGIVTAEALRRLGVEQVVTPPRPGIESMARALSATLEKVT